MTDRVDINRLLVEMRSLKAQTQAFQRPQGLAPSDVNELRRSGPVGVDGVSKTPGFGEVMSQAINKVNDVQKTSSAMATAYEQGVPGVDITDRKSTRLNSSHVKISYAVFCLKKKK